MPILQTEDHKKIPYVIRDAGRIHIFSAMMNRSPDRAYEATKEYFNRVFQANPTLAEYIKGNHDS